MRQEEVKQEEVKHEEVKQEEAWIGAGAGKINIGEKFLFLLGAEVFMCRIKRNFFPGSKLSFTVGAKL